MVVTHCRNYVIPDVSLLYSSEEVKLVLFTMTAKNIEHTNHPENFHLITWALSPRGLCTLPNKVRYTFFKESIAMIFTVHRANLQLNNPFPTLAPVLRITYCSSCHA